MKVLSIDPSSSAIGFAYFENDLPIFCETFKPKGDTLIDRMQPIVVRIMYFINLYHPDFVAVETPYMGLNRSTSVKMGQIFGFVCAAMVMSGIMSDKILQIHPMTVKKAAGLETKEKRTYGKEFVLHAMHERFPFLKIEDDNSSDALAIGLAGINILKEAKKE